MKKLLLVGCFVPGLALAQDNLPPTQGVQSWPGPNDNGLTWTAVTCAATSTPFGVLGKQYITVQVPPNATQTVWFAWGGTVGTPTTATTSVPSQGYGAGTNIAWGGGTGSCIVASGSQVISVGTK